MIELEEQKIREDQKNLLIATSLGCSLTVLSGMPVAAAVGRLPLAWTAVETSGLPQRTPLVGRTWEGPQGRASRQGQGGEAGRRRDDG